VRPVFGTTDLVIDDEEITDKNGTALAEIRRPRLSWRTLPPGSREGLSVVGTDGTTLLRLEHPQGPKITSLWVRDGAGDPVGEFRNRSRLAPAGGRFDVLRDDAVIGTAHSGTLLDFLEAATAEGERVATAERVGESWFVELSPGITDDWTRLFVALVIATEQVRFQQREW